MSSYSTSIQQYVSNCRYYSRNDNLSFPSTSLYNLSYFLLIFYLHRCTLPDFPCFSPGFLAIFTLTSSNNNTVEWAVNLQQYISNCRYYSTNDNLQSRKCYQHQLTTSRVIHHYDSCITSHVLYEIWLTTLRAMHEIRRMMYVQMFWTNFSN